MVMYPIPSASTGSSNVSYCKMKGNNYRYLAEFSTGDARTRPRHEGHQKEWVVTHLTPMSQRVSARRLNTVHWSCILQ